MAVFLGGAEVDPAQAEGVGHLLPAPDEIETVHNLTKTAF
jgi:hypothetical protein